jgi:trimethylamine--corrinoid protein Co-methyltransferase
MAQARISFLSDADKQRIHEETLWVLDHVGVSFNTPEAIDLLAKAGVPVDRGALTARIAARHVEQALRAVPHHVLLAARDASHDVSLGDPHLACCTDGTATYMLDDETGEREPGNAEHLRRAMRLFDALDEVDYVWPSISARDLDPLTANLEIEAISLEACGKHLQDEVRAPEYVAPLLEMLEAVAGAPMKERPIFSAINCTIAPLQHDGPMTEASMRLARAGVPIFVMPMPLMGTTAPMSVMATVVINMAELLSAVVLFQFAAPGCAVVAASEPAAADMRSGLYLCGAAEASLMSLACVEMAQHYGLPNQAAGLGGDGSYPDYQEGAEGMLAATMLALAGADSLLAFGTLDGAQTLSLAKTVLDCEAVGMIRRASGRLAVDDGSLLRDDIREVGPGGHFLARRSTRARHRGGELWEPAVFRRGPHRGRPAELVQEAAAKVRDILATHAPPPIPEGVRREMDRIIAAFARTAGGRG